MPGAMRPSAPRPQTFGGMRPNSQVPRMMSTQRVGQSPILGQQSVWLQQQFTCMAAAFVFVLMFIALAAAQTMGPRPATAAAAAAAPVRGVPQYKYAAGVRNTQQHMSQPQVNMQQVGMHTSFLHQLTHSDLHVRESSSSVCAKKVLSDF